MLGQKINGGIVIAAMYDQRDGHRAAIVVQGATSMEKYVTAGVYNPTSEPFAWTELPKEWNYGTYTDSLTRALEDMADRAHAYGT